MSLAFSRLRRWAASGIALGLAIGAGIAAASVADRLDLITTDVSIPAQVAQDVTSISSGIRVSVDGATFSGSGTELALQLEVVDPSQLSGVIQGGSIRNTIPSKDAFSGPFAGVSSSSTRVGENRVVSRLPAIAPAVDYKGSLLVVLSSVDVITSRGTSRVSGDWQFELRGPEVAELAAALRLEDLRAVQVDVLGQEVLIEGQRSQTETIVTVKSAGSVQLLTGPYLVRGAARVTPSRVEGTQGSWVAHFPATEFESSIAVDLGPVAVASPGQATTLAVRVGDVMRRAADGAQGKTDYGTVSHFDVEEVDVIGSQAGIEVREVRRGTYGGSREWVSITVSGTWDPTNGDPQVFDGRGKRLELAGVESGYTKDLNGNIGPGETSVLAFIDPHVDLEVVTVVLGPRSVVQTEGPRLTLQP